MKAKNAKEHRYLEHWKQKCQKDSWIDCHKQIVARPLLTNFSFLTSLSGDLAPHWRAKKTAASFISSTSSLLCSSICVLFFVYFLFSSSLFRHCIWLFLIKKRRNCTKLFLFCAFLSFFFSLFVAVSQFKLFISLVTTFLLVKQLRLRLLSKISGNSFIKFGKIPNLIQLIS